MPMSPFEQQLLLTAWPWVWGAFLSAGSAALGLATWYLKAINGKLSSVNSSVKELQEHITTVEQQITADLTEYKARTQHRLDRIIGAIDSRVGRIETVCEMQHGAVLRRRSTDIADNNWAQNSDISGEKLNSCRAG